MTEPVVSTTEPITLVGGSDIASDDLNISLKVAPVLVAADGGANILYDLGLSPRAVIGDLDSIDAPARARFADLLHGSPDMDTTDFEKAVTRINAPAIVAVGFTGARLDHTLEVFNVVARYPGIVLLGTPDVAFLMPPSATFDLPPGTRLSLMPLGPAQVTTTGMRWNLTGAALSPTGKTSASNEVASSPATVQVQGPVLAILPRAYLTLAIDVVRAAQYTDPPQP